MKKNILLAACFLMPLIASAQNDTLTHERDITLAEAIALARTVCRCRGGAQRVENSLLGIPYFPCRPVARSKLYRNITQL